MQSPHHLLADIQQQTADLAGTIRQYEQYYGPLPLDALASSLLTTLLASPQLTSTHLNSIQHHSSELPPRAPKEATSHLTPFMTSEIQSAHSRSQFTLSQHYHNALNIFLQFNNNQDIALQSITPHLIKSFEVWLLNVRGVRRNTSSFYMRQLRAVYNRAVKAGLTPDRHPFADVYTGIDKTRHRALDLHDLRRLKHLDLTHEPDLAQARDLFLFSYYTRGMSFVDMAYLRTTDLSHGQLTYTRRKTHQTLTIQWEPEMQHLLTRLQSLKPELCSLKPSETLKPLETLKPETLKPLETLKPETLKPELSSLKPEPCSPFLLPILPSLSLDPLKPETQSSLKPELCSMKPLETPPQSPTLHTALRRASLRLNHLLHRLGERLQLPIPLTMYVARHTWATTAYNRGTPISVIGQALGHSGASERTTSIYLASMNHQVIDRANRALINAVG